MLGFFLSRLTFQSRLFSFSGEEPARNPVSCCFRPNFCFRDGPNYLSMKKLNKSQDTCSSYQFKQFPGLTAKRLDPTHMEFHDFSGFMVPGKNRIPGAHDICFPSKGKEV